MKNLIALAALSLCLSSCASKKEMTSKTTKKPFFWESATVYFLLIDRFNNGSKSNDYNYNRNSNSME